MPVSVVYVDTPARTRVDRFRLYIFKSLRRRRQVGIHTSQNGRDEAHYLLRASAAFEYRRSAGLDLFSGGYTRNLQVPRNNPFS